MPPGGEEASPSRGRGWELAAPGAVGAAPCPVRIQQAPGVESCSTPGFGSGRGMGHGVLGRRTPLAEEEMRAGSVRLWEESVGFGGAGAGWRCWVTLGTLAGICLPLQQAAWFTAGLCLAQLAPCR